jgi:hypothetical protein
MSQGGRWPRATRWLKSATRVVAIVPVVLACAGFAQQAKAGAGECNLPADPKGTTIALSEQDGRAELTVTRPNSAGRKFKIEYSDEMFVGKFDAQGRATLTFALIAPSNEISIRLAEVSVINCKIDVPEFGKIYRVVMRWRDPVRLDLDVVEPGRQPGGFGNVNRSRPNTDLQQGAGQMDVISDPAEEGATGEISYLVANGAALLAAGTPTLRLDYVSRGNRPEPPYCGDHPRASIQFELYVISRGEVKRSNFSTARARCGEPLPDSARLMRLRH